jgi:hypothetical protein
MSVGVLASILYASLLLLPRGFGEQLAPLVQSLERNVFQFCAIVFSLWKLNEHSSWADLLGRSSFGELTFNRITLSNPLTWYMAITDDSMSFGQKLQRTANGLLNTLNALPVPTLLDMYPHIDCSVNEERSHEVTRLSHQEQPSTLRLSTLSNDLRRLTTELIHSSVSPERVRARSELTNNSQKQFDELLHDELVKARERGQSRYEGRREILIAVYGTLGSLMLYDTPETDSTSDSDSADN